MTVTDKTEPAQTDAITFEFDLAHPPARVWRALTDPVLLSEWLLPITGLQLEVGAAFTFKADPQPGWDGRVDCRFTEIEPLRRLSYAWTVASGLNTVVTFTLSPTAEGTRMVMVQSGFRADQKQNLAGARYGWRMMGGRLEDALLRANGEGRHA